MESHSKQGNADHKTPPYEAGSKVGETPVYFLSSVRTKCDNRIQDIFNNFTI